jgi:outer membrane protein TolC
MTPLFLLLMRLALADPPADLNALVQMALERDPTAAALQYEAQAAGSRAQGTRRPMDPQLMFGVGALGAPMDSVDPTMLMVGATQMFRGPGEARAQAAIPALLADRSEADLARLQADLCLQLWQTAARVRALQAELQLVDEQARAAGALLEVARVRYGAGAAPGGMGSGMGSASGMGGMNAPDGAMGMGASPPAVLARSGGGSMAGMGGMGGASRADAVAVPAPMAASDAPLPTTGGGGGGLPALLRLDAAVARLEADRAALRADLDGELTVLEALVGQEGAAAVNASPERFLGAELGNEAPETRLAEIEAEIAEAELNAAQIARRPDWMVAGALRIMPEGMVEGADISVGVELPVWGSKQQEIDARAADLSAVERRVSAVERDLTVARARAQATLVAATARADVLESTALPRAESAWKASVQLYASGQGDAESALQAWQIWTELGREAVRARRDAELRAAELARLGGSGP